MKRLIPVLIAALVAAVPTASAEAGPGRVDAQRATRYCNRGERALQVGNLTKARESFTRALAIDPHFADAHLGLGHIAMAEKQYEAALAQYEIANEDYSDVGRRIYEREATRYTEARQEILELRDEIALRERIAPVPMQLSKLEQAVHRLEALSPPARSSLQEAPGRIHFYRGNALFRMGRRDEAVNAWETCVTASPDYAPAYNNLIVGYWTSGRITKAREILKKAESLGLFINPDLKADLERDAMLRSAQRG
jgi:tetratricopeptide (TPR) repeat protein